VRFEDGERVEWAMRSIVRGVKEENAGRVYQVRLACLVFVFVFGRNEDGGAADVDLVARWAAISRFPVSILGRCLSVDRSPRARSTGDILSPSHS
jgi:hypothetical protein